MKCSGIYRLFCTASGKSYVGQSLDVVQRVTVHFRKLHQQQHHNEHMQASFNLHGHITFMAEVLEYCSPDVLTEREQYWMNRYGFENLYNMCPAAGSVSGIKRSNKTRELISASKKKYRFTDEHRANISKANSSHKLSAEHRKRIGENHVGMKGKKHSDETKAKISQAMKNRNSV